jgi:proline dehydrogenase
MMLRRLLLYLSEAGWAKGVVTHMGAARRVALRFVAGESLDDALRASRQLNDQGLLVTLDYLGESVHQAEDTQDVVETYTTLIETIAAQNLRAGVSLKLTHLGLDISEDLCLANLRSVLAAAQGQAVPVTVDMESSHYTENTLRIVRTMRHEYGFTNLQTVIQSYLRRSEADMRALAAEGASIRLVKGAYLEKPEIAFPEKSDVDANFITLAEIFLAADEPAFLAIASHDENMIAAVLDFIAKNDVPSHRYEFQMLYGIRTARQVELAESGHAMRVYVPFGSSWYAYFMRRLAERPANLKFFLRSLFRR